VQGLAGTVTAANHRGSKHCGEFGSLLLVVDEAYSSPMLRKGFVGQSEGLLHTPATPIVTLDHLMTNVLSPVLDCTTTTLITYRQVNALCSAKRTRPGCAPCLQSYDANKTYGNCDLLGVWGDICVAEPSESLLVCVVGGMDPA